MALYQNRSMALFTERSHQRLQPPHSENSARELRQQPSPSPRSDLRIRIRIRIQASKDPSTWAL
jgi:hypothetical protein